MRRYLLLIFLLGCQHHHSNLAALHTGEYLFVGAGQSNMARMDLSSVFQDALAERGYINVLTLNTAVGGTSLSQWAKGQPLYAAMLSKVQARRNNKKIILLFWQGENEGLPKGDPADTWRLHFEQFVQDVRGDLGLPNLPVIFVQIGKNENYGVPWDTVKSQQAAVNVENVWMVTSDDVEPSFDLLHLTTDGYSIMMKRLASVFIDDVDIRLTQKS